MSPQDDGDRVSVHLSVTAADIKAFSSYVASGPDMAILRRNRRLYVAACGAGGAVLGFAVTDWSAAIWLLLPIAVAATLLSRSNADARFELLRPSFEADLTADATGLTTTRPGSTSHIRWSALQELVVTDTHVFVRVGPLIGDVIPRRCLHDPGDVDRLIRWRLAAKAAVANHRPPPPPRYQPTQ